MFSVCMPFDCSCHLDFFHFGDIVSVFKVRLWNTLGLGFAHHGYLTSAGDTGLKHPGSSSEINSTASHPIPQGLGILHYTVGRGTSWCT